MPRIVDLFDPAEHRAVPAQRLLLALVVYFQRALECLLLPAIIHIFLAP